MVPATYTTQAVVGGEKGYFQIISGSGSGSGSASVEAVAPKSLVSIFTSVIKSAVSSSPAVPVEGVLGEFVITLN